MKNRYREIDFIRAISMLSVIVIHISAMSVDTSSGLFINQIVRFAVPMFILLSGFVLFKPNTDVSTGGKYISLIAPRLMKVIPPYLIWSAIYILYREANDNKAFKLATFLTRSMKEVFTGTSYSHLYFIIIIIQLYILYPLIARCLSKKPKLTLAIGFTTGLFLQLFIQLLSCKVLVMPRSPFPYIFMFPVWIGYFIVGMYARLNYEKIVQIAKPKTLLLTIPIWLLSLALVIFDAKITNSVGLSARPTIVLYTLCSFVVFVTLFRGVTNSNRMSLKILDYMSKQSFFYYFVHSLLLATVFPPLVKAMPLVFRDTHGLLVKFILVTCITTLLAFVVSYLPGCKLLGCEPHNVHKGSHKDHNISLSL